jgi:hypothetical protein
MLDIRYESEFEWALSEKVVVKPENVPIMLIISGPAMPVSEETQLSFILELVFPTFQLIGTCFVQRSSSHDVTRPDKE